VYDPLARTFSSAEYFVRVTRRVVRTPASTLSSFSAVLPPRCHASAEHCVSADRFSIPVVSDDTDLQSSQPRQSTPTRLHAHIPGIPALPQVAERNIGRPMDVAGESLL